MYTPKHIRRKRMDFTTIIVIIEMIFIVCLIAMSYKDVTDEFEKELKETIALADKPIESTEPIETKPEPIATYVPSEEPLDPTFHIQVNEEDAILLAKTAWGEYNAISRSKTQVASVMWCILNRVDAQYDGQKTISEVVRAAGQFNGYSKYAPVIDEFVELAKDVLFRHEMEKHYGIAEDVSGRVLPSQYMWFTGNGTVNIFTDAWQNGNVWDFSWGNPYGEE